MRRSQIIDWIVWLWWYWCMKERDGGSHQGSIMPDLGRQSAQFTYTYLHLHWSKRWEHEMRWDNFKKKKIDPLLRSSGQLPYGAWGQDADFPDTDLVDAFFLYNQYRVPKIYKYAFSVCTFSSHSRPEWFSETAASYHINHTFSSPVCCCYFSQESLQVLSLKVACLFTSTHWSFLKLS